MCGRRRAASSTRSPTDRGDAGRGPDRPGDGHPRAPAPDRVHGRDHDPQGAPREVRPGVPRRPDVPAHGVRARARSARSTGGTPGPRSRSGTAGRREAFGLVTTLPFSRGPRDHVHPLPDGRRPAHRARWAASCAWAACRTPLVFDNDASVVASGIGSRARLHDDVRGPARRPPRPRRSSCARRTPRPRARSSARSGTPRRASCRCASSARSTTSRASTTPGPPTSPTAATSAASAARSPTGTPPSAPHLGPVPDPRPRHRPAPRGPGRAGTPSCGCAASTTRCRPCSPGGGSRPG